VIAEFRAISGQEIEQSPHRCGRLAAGAYHGWAVGADFVGGGSDYDRVLTDPDHSHAHWLAVETQLAQRDQRGLPSLPVELQDPAERCFGVAWKAEAEYQR